MMGLTESSFLERMEIMGFVRHTKACDCTGCRYKNQDPNEDPCYRCHNSSEYVPENLPETIPDADGWEHVCIPKKGSL